MWQVKLYYYKEDVCRRVKKRVNGSIERFEYRISVCGKIRRVKVNGKQILKNVLYYKNKLLE